jgi:S-formylglutathione hydrolase
MRRVIGKGTGDSFYKQGQLLPENFTTAAREAGHDEGRVRVRRQEGYDHSYYFVSNAQWKESSYHC